VQQITIDVVPEVSGRVVNSAVTDNQAVKQGDLLFRIRPRPYEADLAKPKPASRRWISKLCSPSVALTPDGLVPTRLMPRSRTMPPLNRPQIHYAAPSHY
ncbi:hypothetical protein ACULNC_21165, partial [Shigella flexneri]